MDRIRERKVSLEWIVKNVIESDFEEHEVKVESIYGFDIDYCDIIERDDVTGLLTIKVIGECHVENSIEGINRFIDEIGTDATLSLNDTNLVIESEKVYHIKTID